MGPSKSLLAIRLLWPSIGVFLLAFYIQFLVIYQPGQQVEAIKAKKILYGLAIAHLLGIHPKDIHNAIIGERRQIIHPMPPMPPMPHPMILPTPSVPSCYKPKKRCRKKMKALQAYDMDDDDYYEEYHHFEDDGDAFDDHDEHYPRKPPVQFDDDEEYTVRHSTPTYMDDETTTSMEDSPPDGVNSYPEDEPTASYDKTPEEGDGAEESKEFHKVTQLPRGKKLQRFLRLKWKPKGEKQKKFIPDSTVQPETINLGDKPHPSTQQKYKKYKQQKKKKKKRGKGRSKDAYFIEETKPNMELDSGESQKVETAKETNVKKSIKNYFKYFWKEPKRGKGRKKLKHPKESGTLTEPPKPMHHFAVPDVVPMPNIAFQVGHQMQLPPHHPMPMPLPMPIGATPPGSKFFIDPLGQQHLAAGSEVVLEQHVMHPFRRKDRVTEKRPEVTQLSGSASPTTSTATTTPATR